MISLKRAAWLPDRGGGEPKERKQSRNAQPKPPKIVKQLEGSEAVAGSGTEAGPTSPATPSTSSFRCTPLPSLLLPSPSPLAGSTFASYKHHSFWPLVHGIKVISRMPPVASASVLHATAAGRGAEGQGRGAARESCGKNAPFARKHHQNSSISAKNL